MGKIALEGLTVASLLLGVAVPAWADDPVMPPPPVASTIVYRYNGPLAAPFKVASPGTPYVPSQPAAAATQPGAAQTVVTATVPASSTPATSSAPSAKPATTTYTVVSGDTLSGVAARYGVSLASLVAANPQITDPNKIWVGDHVKVPAGSGFGASSDGGGGGTTTTTAGTGTTSTTGTTTASTTVSGSGASTGTPGAPTGPVVAGNSGSDAADAAAKSLVGTSNSSDATGSWSGWCLHLVNVAYAKAGHPLPELQSDCAKDAYNQFKSEGLVQTGANPPKGAIVFWSWVGTLGGVTKDWGHVAISNGDGTCVSTLLSGGINPAASIAGFGTPLGWVLPPESK